MIDVAEFKKLIDKCSCMEDFHILLNALLEEYVALEKEYDILEQQKVDVMLPAIDAVIGIKSNSDDIEHLRNMVSTLKAQLGTHLNEKKELEKSLLKLTIENKITEKQLKYFKEKNLIVTKNMYQCDDCEHEWSYVRAERQFSDCPVCKKKHIYPRHRKILTY